MSEVKEGLQQWIDKYEKKYLDMGYHKYIQHYKSEDFAYWKTFREGDMKLYQTGILIYDFTKYGENRIGTQYECMILGDNRIDLTVCDHTIEIEGFEIMARTFYEAMKHYNNNSTQIRYE